MTARLRRWIYPGMRPHRYQLFGGLSLAAGILLERSAAWAFPHAAPLQN